MADRVAVVFIHGMGEQRRYADTAELASRLAAHARTHPEFRDGHEDPRVDVVWDDDRGAAAPRPRARASVTARLAGQHIAFHDAYWAPIVAGKTGFRSMFRWMRGRSWQPLWYLFARWASHAQLKIDVLHENRDRVSEREQRLVASYQEFVKSSGHHRPRKLDSFGAYCDHLRASAPELVAPARHWLTRYALAMAWAFLRTAPILVALGAAALSVPLVGVWIYREFANGPTEALSWVWIGIVFALWLATFYVARQLVHYVGDVEVYATYNEASERWATREAVLKLATDALREPLLDANVARVVLVAHSLGSFVAWDAVRALALEAHAGGGVSASQMAKLSRVITYGSPVDKIRFYHFADDGNDPVFRDILEKLRVDTGHKVFGGGLAWENYYDPADLIGGRLESPNDRWMTHPVRNVAVANRPIPDPAHAHTAYLENDTVLAGILRAIQGDAPPSPSAPGAHGARAWVTMIEIVLVTAGIAYFVATQLAPVVGVGPAADLFAWVALALVIVMLAWLA